MSQELYADKPKFSTEQLERVSLPAIQLFTDEHKFGLYADFKAKYAGEPSQVLPELVRDRGSVAVTYDQTILSAMTQSGSHLLHVRRGHNPNYNGLEPTLQYFVATVDFNTSETTEWWVSEVHASGLNQPHALELYLSNQPMREVTKNPEIDADTPILQAIGLRRLAELARQKTQAESIRFSVTDRARLSWGDGKSPEIFTSTFEIENDLWLLHQAEQSGLLGDKVSHESVREHLGKAA